jgi:hypothetical protein
VARASGNCLRYVGGSRQKIRHALLPKPQTLTPKPSGNCLTYVDNLRQGSGMH